MKIVKSLVVALVLGSTTEPAHAELVGRNTEIADLSIHERAHTFFDNLKEFPSNLFSSPQKAALSKRTSEVENQVWGKINEIGTKAVGHTSKFGGRIYHNLEPQIDALAALMKDLKLLKASVDSQFLKEYEMLELSLLTLIDLLADRVLVENLTSEDAEIILRENFASEDIEKNILKEVEISKKLAIDLINNALPEEISNERLLKLVHDLTKFVTGPAIAKTSHLLFEAADILASVDVIIEKVQNNEAVAKMFRETKDKIFTHITEYIFDETITKLSMDVTNELDTLNALLLEDPVFRERVFKLDDTVDLYLNEVSKIGGQIVYSIEQVGEDLVKRTFLASTILSFDKSAQRDVAEMLKKIMHVAYLAGTTHLDDATKIGQEVLETVRVQIRTTPNPALRNVLVGSVDLLKRLVTEISSGAAHVLEAHDLVLKELGEISDSIKAHPEKYEALHASLTAFETKFSSYQTALSEATLDRQSKVMYEVGIFAWDAIVKLDKDGDLDELEKIESDLKALPKKYPFLKKLGRVFQKKPEEPQDAELKSFSFKALPPAWILDESIEAPSGIEDHGTWQGKIYTEEQQQRLNVNKHGNSLEGARAGSNEADKVSALIQESMAQDTEETIAKSSALGKVDKVGNKDAILSMRQAKSVVRELATGRSQIEDFPNELLSGENFLVLDQAAKQLNTQTQIHATLFGVAGLIALSFLLLGFKRFSIHRKYESINK